MMIQKTKRIFYGILAVLAFALILGACPADSGSPGNVYSLNLSGKVYSVQDINPVTFKFNYDEYKGNLNISDGGLGGIGKINNGQLNYTIEEPLSLSPIIDEESLAWLKEMYPSMKFSSKDVNAAGVALEITGNDEYSTLLKSLMDVKISSSLTTIAMTLTIETVSYIYVDKDIKITADKDSFEYPGESVGLPFPISLTTEKINLSLKEGWNSLYSKITVEVMDLSALRPKGNLKMSVGDPSSLKWTLVPSQIEGF